MKGVISNLITARYYGFIRGENGQEYFFHRDDLNGDWHQLAKDWDNFLITKINVSFEPKATPKGPRATNVNLIQNV